MLLDWINDPTFGQVPRIKSIDAEKRPSAARFTVF